MALMLRDGLYHRQIGDAVIFLDLPVDRYFLLTDGHAEDFLRALSGEASASDWLIERGIFADRKTEEGTEPDALVAPKISLVDGPLDEASVATTAASLWLQWRTRKELRRRPLSSIIGELKSAGRRETAQPNDAVIAGVAAAFLCAKRYAPAIDQCLVRSIAMKRMLMHRGSAVSLVFGVTMPFAAHCWVQAGSTVLSDPLDIVLHYKPILAV
ncbi:lasso peptide biosynthesis B2 protein [Sphingopyxis sp.]|uniref:lasso peptide biosynthesis B2 protein n=1 Tax=Sphingopyxis sp. TaxID=1908224 RepID=UPI002D78AA1D|nr:lasso peptide biosynthesis B2 protein [Sphingopyxis sp.]HET6523515.1 lasso peptide biosynthesis B2 protein [Sphingopyxis sp.]